MNKLQQLQEALLSKRGEMKTLLATLKADGQYRKPTEEENAKLAALNAEISDHQTEYDAIKSLSDIENLTENEIKALSQNRTLPRPDEDQSDFRKRLLRTESLKCFKGTDKISAEEQAYRFGHHVLASVFMRPDSIKFCKSKGLPFNYVSNNSDEIKAMGEATSTAGGILVPDEFSSNIIDLRESYGLFRQHVRIEPMGSETLNIRRRSQGMTVYYPGEGQTLTASELKFNSVLLTAKKYAALGVYSSELGEDAVINFGDRIAEEAAYAFAVAEDDNGFNGDGTSAYASTIGIRTKIKGLSSTIADIAGLVVGSGNAYSELTLNDFLNVVGTLPVYADTPNAAWFAHKYFYYTVMLKLALASGGVTESEVIQGQRTPMFLGYPVRFAQKMPKAEANSQVCTLLGDLNKGVALGDRRMITIAVSDQYKFDTDELAVKVTQRVAINAHDVGNADSTAANRVPGPIVGLITAAA